MDPDDNSILYIYLVNPSQAAAEAAAVKYYGRDRMQDIKETRPLRAQYTMEQLKEWYDKDLGEARPFSLPEVTMTDLDEGKNRIEVGINCESSRDGVRRELQKRLTLQGVPLEAVVYTVRGRAYPLIGPPVFECVPSETFDPAKELSTPGFGGLYIDSSTAYVYLLEPSQEKAEELVLNQLGRESFERIQKVQALKGLYTWQQLTEWYELIKDDLRENPATDVVSIDPRKNRLTIEVRTEYEDNAEREIRAVLSRHGVLYEAVVLLAD